MAAKTAPRTADLRRRLQTARRERQLFARALAEANGRFSEKVKELSILRRIGDSISSRLDERTVCESLVNIIISEMTAENCSLMLKTGDGRELMLRAAQGQADPAPRFFHAGDRSAPRIAVGDGVAGWVAKTGKPMLVKNTADEAHFKKLRKGIKNITSLLCMPILREKEIIGVLNLSHPDIGQFSQENERLLRLIVSQAALAFSNIRLFERQRRFNEELERAVTDRTGELRLSETKYRALMQQGSDGIVIADDRGVIIECNDTAAAMTGRKPGAWEGKALAALLPEVADDAVRLLRSKTPSQKGLRRDTLLRAGRKEQGIPVSIGATVIRLARGKVLYVTMRDITEQVLLDQKLKNYSRELEEEVQRRTCELQATQNELIQTAKLAALGELASGVAHEINNPIAIIAGYAEDMKDRILKGESPGKTTLIGTLDMIVASAQRAHLITQEILDFSSPRATRIAAHNLGELLKTSVSMLRSRLKSGEHSVRLGGDALGLTLHTDKNHIVQVMINLLTNAVDASERKGPIGIRARRIDHRIEVTVTDRGHGIAKEHLGKIFDPFFTTKEPGKGTGLGLSISYRIVQKLRGRLTVTSRPGKTAFTVHLPLDEHNHGLEDRGTDKHG